MERLQKVLMRGGVASRRKAERLIVQGRVRACGQVITTLGTKIDPDHTRVEVDGRLVRAERLVYLVFHKPRHVVTTMQDPQGRPTVADALQEVGVRVYPVGRLDYATSGVLLATNDGAFASGLLHPKRRVPKVYLAKVYGCMQEQDLELWQRGVELDGRRAKVEKASVVRREQGKTWVRLTLVQGKKRQIRRMGQQLGFAVMRLVRVAFAGVTVRGLQPGQWRLLTRQELLTLRRQYGIPKKIEGEGSPEQNNRQQRASRADD